MSLPSDTQEQDLDRRARELDEREASLRTQEAHQRRIGQLGAHFSYEIEIDSAGQLELSWKAGSADPIAGYSLSEAQSSDWSQAVHPEDQAIVWKLLTRALREGYADAEFRIEGTSGETHWLKNSVQRVEEHGRSFLLGIVQDVTERMRVDRELAGYRSNLEELVAERTDELERSRQQLRHSERLASLGTLAAGIAHQINNPIGVILAATQHALDCEGDEDATEVWRKALRESESHAQRCAGIVRSVLQFSRDEPAEKREENLRGALRRACSLTRSYAQKRRASLSLQEGGEPVLVHMNFVEIEQVLVNILRNAVESKESGASVVVAIETDAQRARVSVSDDGSGIPETVISRVFDPFFTTRLGEGGTGLGLSVAHGIVTDHGGRMEIANLETGGCCIRIELPLATSSEEAEQD